MARKKKHEEHANHEAWAIPYGDLVTLLFALFTVMYAVSSVNEGKFRVLSEAMSVAFGGPPRTMHPIQIGDAQSKGAEIRGERTLFPQPLVRPSFGVLRDLHNRQALPGIVQSPVSQHDNQRSGSTGYADGEKNLHRIATAVQAAMKELIDKGLITVRPGDNWLEVEIKTDILFNSGSADLAAVSKPTLQKIVDILKPFPNQLRIEGHTDDMPIRTAVFPSNWELSSARAASVVHLFMQEGLDPTRMSVAGFGEYRPVSSNDTVEGRNRNRRVVLVILAGADDPRALDLGRQTLSAEMPAPAAPQPIPVPQQGTAP